MPTPSEPSTQWPAHVKTQKPSNFTVKKGKWYDCLRPVPGYQGFGGMGPESYSNETTTKEEKEAHAKIKDYTTKVPSLGFRKSNAKKESK